MDRITCSYCDRQCVPKLWHYQPMPGALRYMRTQHICPFCGAVMYESGGQLNPVGWIVAVLVGSGMAAGVIAELSRTTDTSRIIGIVGSVIFWGSIIYWILRRKK